MYQVYIYIYRYFIVELPFRYVLAVAKKKKKTPATKMPTYHEYTLTKRIKSLQNVFNHYKTY